MPNYYAQYPQYYQPYNQQPYNQPQQTPQQIQNGGFVSVRSEVEARNYPIAPGNSVTFKDETAPYVYTKTMGFSQLDRPIFEKYKLVKEDVVESVEPTNDKFSEVNDKLSDIESDIQKLWGEIDAVKIQVNEQTHTTTRKTKSESKNGGDD